MPVIRTPFERVAVDLIGPFSPKSERGNRYILTLIDFATRYADAIALPAIDAVHVAEGLIEIFSHIRLPQKIVSDQGTSLTAQLMEEVGRLLSIKFLRTTSYHAMANGLVEKSNGTPRTMLKRMCQEKPRSWDRYLSPLLFAYREVPQASIGFTFSAHLWPPRTGTPDGAERAYGAERDDIDNETRTTYTYLVDLRNRIEETCELAQNELQKARAKQKNYFD